MGAAGHLPTPCLQDKASPGEAGMGKPKSSRNLDMDHYTYRNPPGERERWHAAGGMGYSTVPPPPRPHPQETHKSPSTWGETKSTGAAGGRCFTSWHSLASSSSEVGVPEPSSSPPHAGQARPQSERSDADPGPVPSWLDRHAIFCLKRKRFTQAKTSKGLSPSHPHTNRFI